MQAVETLLSFARPDTSFDLVQQWHSPVAFHTFGGWGGCGAHVSCSRSHALLASLPTTRTPPRRACGGSGAARCCLAACWRVDVGIRRDLGRPGAQLVVQEMGGSQARTLVIRPMREVPMTACAVVRTSSLGAVSRISTTVGLNCASGDIQATYYLYPRLRMHYMYATAGTVAVDSFAASWCLGAR